MYIFSIFLPKYTEKCHFFNNIAQKWKRLFVKSMRKLLDIKR